MGYALAAGGLGVSPAPLHFPLLPLGEGGQGDEGKMIVDIHAHLMGPEVPGKAFWDGFTRLAVVQSGRTAERVR